MAEWTYKIGAPSNEGSGYLRWDRLQSGAIDSGLVDGGGMAHLRVLRLYYGSFSRLYTSPSLVQSSFNLGPDLTAAFEQSAHAITVSAGSLSVTVPGPNHTTNQYKDTQEPYTFLPSVSVRNEINAFITAYRRLSGDDQAETMITLSDTIPLPALSITADISTITEGADAVFMLSSSIAPASDLTVRISVTQTGDVVSGAAPTTATIGAGKTGASITIPTATNPLGPGEQGSITVTISADAGYTISASSHTVTVVNYIPLPALSITADISTITEGADAAFALSSSIAPASDLTVRISVTETGDVISGAAPTTAVIGAGKTGASITIPTDDDAIDEGHSTVTVTILAGRGYTIGSDSSAASVIVRDNEVSLAEILGGSRLTAVPLIDITLRDGVTEKHIYASNRFVTVGGKKYLDILSEDGISDISHDLDSAGGIATISSATIRLLNATGDADIPLSHVLEKYKIVGQPVDIRYIFPPSTQAIGVWSGKVAQVSVGSEITLSLVNTTLDDITPVPTQVHTLAKNPSLPLSSTGLPYPVVFGSLDSAENRVLAPAIRTSAFSHQYMTAVRARQRGNIYILPAGGDLSRINGTQSGDHITLTGSGTLTVSRRLPDLYFSPPPFGQPLHSHYNLGALRVNGAGIIKSITLSGQVTTRGVYSRGGSRMGIILTTHLGNTSNRRKYSSIGHTHPPSEGVRTKTSAYSETLNVSAGNASADPREWFVRFASFTQERVGPELISATVTVSISYEYDIEDLTSPAVFQGIAGYQDRAANYHDGGVVNTDGMTLSHPVDIIHALLRDRDYGMSWKSGLIDRSDIDFQRTAVGGGRRFDFVTREIITFDDFSDMVRQAGCFMRYGPNGKWEIRGIQTQGPTHMFTHAWNIDDGSFLAGSSPLRDVKNHFFLRYGYSHTEEAFTKSLVRSGQRNGRGHGNLLASGRFFVTSSSPPEIAVGDRVLFAEKYYIVTKAVSQTTYEVRRDNGGPVVAAQNQPFEVGPYFDRTCYDSEQAYGRKSYLGSQTSAIESRLIQDDGTARAFLDDLIRHHASVAKTVQFSTHMGAIGVSVGDEIIVDHPYARGVEKIGTLSSALSQSATSITWDLDQGVTVRALDYVILQSGVYFEVLRSGGGSAISRAQLKSTSRAWPSDTAIYRALRTYIVTHPTLSPSAGRINIRAREVALQDIYDTPFPPRGQAGEQAEPAPLPTLSLDGEALSLDGDYLTTLP